MMNEKMNKQSLVRLVIIAIIVLALGAGIFFLSHVLKGGINAAKKAYKRQKEQISSEAYETFYNKAYSAGETAHHVSNKVLISLGNIREEAKLEVLKVNSVDYQIVDQQNNALCEAIKNATGRNISGLDCWLEIPGNGVFTIDLRTAEIITDQERAYVLFRLARPILSEFSIDYPNVTILEAQEALIGSNNAKAGEEVARMAILDSDIRMREEITTNQEYYKYAMQNAEKLLENLVKDLNPNVSDLKVEINWLD